MPNNSCFCFGDDEQTQRSAEVERLKTKVSPLTEVVARLQRTLVAQAGRTGAERHSFATTEVSDYVRSYADQRRLRAIALRRRNDLEVDCDGSTSFQLRPKLRWTENNFNRT